MIKMLLCFMVVLSLQVTAFLTGKSMMPVTAVARPAMEVQTRRSRSRPRTDVSFPLSRAVEDLSSLFDDWDLDLPAASLLSSLPSMSMGLMPMPMDIRETNDSYMVAMDLPGIKESDIRVTKTDHELRISAHRHHEKTEEGTTFRRSERFVGSSSRTVALPRDADTSAISAEYKHGVLTVSVRKLAEEASKDQHIPIKFTERERIENPATPFQV